MLASWEQFFESFVFRSWVSFQGCKITGVALDTHRLASEWRDLVGREIPPYSLLWLLTAAGVGQLASFPPSLSFTCYLQATENGSTYFKKSPWRGGTVPGREPLT